MERFMFLFSLFGLFGTLALGTAGSTRAFDHLKERAAQAQRRIMVAGIILDSAAIGYLVLFSDKVWHEALWGHQNKSAAWMIFISVVALIPLLYFAWKANQALREGYKEWDGN